MSGIRQRPDRATVGSVWPLNPVFRPLASTAPARLAAAIAAQARAAADERQLPALLARVALVALLPGETDAFGPTCGGRRRRGHTGEPAPVAIRMARAVVAVRGRARFGGRRRLGRLSACPRRPWFEMIGPRVRQRYREGRAGITARSPLAEGGSSFGRVHQARDPPASQRGPADRGR